MKYSLANKQFKKRNNIFGERRHEPVAYEEGDQHLDEIKELGEELQDSKIQQEFMKDAGSRNGRKIVDLFKNKEEAVPQKISKQTFKTQLVEHRMGKHGLSPNVKPSVPLIRTAAKSIIGIKSLSVPRRPFSICSNTIQFQYHSQETQIQLAQTRQLLLKLYMILSKNNEKIVELQALLWLLAERNNSILGELQYSLAYALQLERKVDLFLNTMRNVYENLRISKLKQENLQLFLKQNQQNHSTDRIQSSNKKRNHIIESDKRDKPVKEVEELMSLLDYESDNSLVEPYLQKQTAKQTPRHLQPFRSITYEQDSARGQSKPNPQQTSVFHHYPSHNKQTFRIQPSNFQRLSPFQANKLMSNISQSSHFHNSFKKQQTDPIAITYDKQPSPKSNHSYSFEASQCQKIRTWLKKRGEEGMICWLDDMGCLRRPNMTYVFWPSGEVMRLSPSSFLQLQGQGMVRRHRVQ